MTNLDLDLDAIRRTLANGDPVFPTTVVALCDEAERWQRQAALWADNIADLTRERDALRAAARAYFAAVGSGNGIAAAEQALRAAVEGV